MILEKIIRFFKGYVVINVSGKFPERFLNVCACKGILLSDVTYISKDYVRCSLSARAFKEIEPICEKTGVVTEKVKEGGFPFLKKRYKKRKWLVFGIFAFFAAIFVLNLFVWEIEIEGCEKLIPKAIEENLAELGVKVGAFRGSIDQAKIKNEMLIKMPELSWIWVDTNGSKLTVSVRESVPKPYMFDKNDYCNIVAAKDGIIDSVVVREGTFMFSIGDAVLENDILVSGLMISERGIEPRFIRADAEINARVWYEQTEKFTLFEERRTETGNVKKKSKIKLFAFELTPFWQKAPDFKKYTKETKTHELSLFGKFLGMKITTDTYKEYTIEKIPLSEKSVAELGAKAILLKMEEETAPGAVLKNHSYSYVKNDDNTISVTVVSEFVENIAKRVKVE